MRRKIIIAMTVFTMVLCLSFLGYGVYAHLNQSFTISNTIGFKPSVDSKIYVSIDCAVSGIKQMQSSKIPDGYSSLEEYYRDKGFINKVEFNPSDKENNIAQQLGEWQIKESLEFVDKNTVIIYSFKIANYSNFPIRIEFTDYKDNKYVNNVGSSIVEHAVEGNVKDAWVLKEKQNNIDPIAREFRITSKIRKDVYGFKNIDNSFKVSITMEKSN